MQSSTEVLGPSAARAKGEFSASRGEERWLSELTADERKVFLGVLQRLTRDESS